MRLDLSMMTRVPLVSKSFGFGRPGALGLRHCECGGSLGRGESSLHGSAAAAPTPARLAPPDTTLLLGAARGC